MKNVLTVSKLDEFKSENIKNGWMKKENDFLTYLFCWVVN